MMTEIGNEADCTVSKLHSDFIYYESRLFLREAELKDNDYLLLIYFGTRYHTVFSHFVFLISSDFTFAPRGISHIAKINNNGGGEDIPMWQKLREENLAKAKILVGRHQY